MFKLKLHFMFLISGYHIAATKYHAKKFRKHNDRLQKWVKKTDKLLLGDRKTTFFRTL